MLYKRVDMLTDNSSIDQQPYLCGIDFGKSETGSPDGIWFEGTAMLSAAYKVMGDADDSAKYLESIKLAQYYDFPDDKDPGGNDPPDYEPDYRSIPAASMDNLTTGLGWSYYLSPHIAPAAWFAAVSMNYNMLWGTSLSAPVPLPGDNRGFTPDPALMNDNLSYLENRYYLSGYDNYKKGIVIVDPRCTDSPYSGDTCIKISWNGQAGRNGKWAALLWQEPENEWSGGVGKGYDLRVGAPSKLYFRMRTDDFTSVNGTKAVKVYVSFGYDPDDSHSTAERLYTLYTPPETDTPPNHPTDWKQYQITVNGDMSHISNGFKVRFNASSSPRTDNKYNIYIDDIRYDYDPTP
jgi:hypothetical protein